MDFLTAPTIKNWTSKIQNGERPPFKSPYLSNCLTDFDEIRHGDADAY